MPKTSIHKFLNLPIKINSEFYDTDMVDKENITMNMSDSILFHIRPKIDNIKSDEKETNGQTSTAIKTRIIVHTARID